MTGISEYLLDGWDAPVTRWSNPFLTTDGANMIGINFISNQAALGGAEGGFPRDNF